MKAVCFIVQCPYDVDPRVRRKAEALVAAGYSVDALALRPAGRTRRYSLNGVNVRTIALGKKRGGHFRYAFEYLTFFVWATFWVTVQMVHRRYSMVDTNSLPDFLVFSGLFARWMGAKLVLDLHELTPEFYMSKYGVGPDSWRIRPLFAQERASMAFADRVITIHEPAKALLAGRGLRAGKALVIMNTANESRFAQILSRPEPRDPNRFIMMYHGTLTPIYGVDLAIEAFARVRARMPGAELWILGSRSEESGLPELVRTLGLEGIVTFQGLVHPDEIPRWLQRCDVGVLPTRHDVFLQYSFSNKLAELIVVGKPVIAARLKTVRHYFGPEALAYFEPGDIDDLSRQMLRLYADPELRTRLAARAKQELAPIRWEIMRRRYVNFVDGLVGNTPEANGEPAELAAATQ